jgi:hypothetical protein
MNMVVEKPFNKDRAIRILSTLQRQAELSLTAAHVGEECVLGGIIRNGADGLVRSTRLALKMLKASPLAITLKRATSSVVVAGGIESFMQEMFLRKSSDPKYDDSLFFEMMDSVLYETLNTLGRVGIPIPRPSHVFDSQPWLDAAVRGFKEAEHIYRQGGEFKVLTARVYSTRDFVENFPKKPDIWHTPIKSFGIVFDTESFQPHHLSAASVQRVRGDDYEYGRFVNSRSLQLDGPPIRTLEGTVVECLEQFLGELSEKHGGLHLVGDTMDGALSDASNTGEGNLALT